MVIFFEAQCKKGEPIEVAIATAIAGFETRFKCKATVVRININNPASVDLPEGVRLERLRNVLPGAALAGGEAGIW